MSEAATRTVSVRILALGAEGEEALPALERALRGAWAPAGGLEVQRDAAGDDARRARSTLRRWCDRDRADVVLTVGRAGHLRGDFAPELTAALLERPLPGIEERMCLSPPSRPADLLFRGRAGFRGPTLVVNLPGRPARAAAIVRLLAPVIGHALAKARGDGGECGRAGAGR
jgi:molybdopterin biosynthesis enzyme MoaB